MTPRRLMTIEIGQAHAARRIKKMLVPTKGVELSLVDNDHCKRLKDPSSSGRFHLETWLTFSEAAKLDKGNAKRSPGL
jgi:hypothetical protein